MSISKAAVVGLCLIALSACAQYRNTRGVEVSWDAEALAGIERGSTTRADILARLGPPSQVLASGDETALYYLNEGATGEAMLLLLYNRFAVDTRYDRAIFFFDSNDVLSDYATHIRPPAGQ